MPIHRTFSLVLAIGFFPSTAAPGVDWITARGDAQHTGSQLNETALSRSSVAKLRLLWRENFDHSNGLPADPLVFGPFITHRGIKELVIEQDQANNVRAIDADLGTTFWERRLPAGSPASSPCASYKRQPVAPAMSVPPFPIQLKDPKGDDNFSDGNRPIYAFAAGETLYALRPSTGQDFFPPRQVLPAHAHPIAISVIDGAISLLTSTGCHSNAPVQTWTLSPDRSRAQAVPAGFSSPIPENGAGQAAFQLNGVTITAQLTPAGELLLVNQASRLPLFRSKALDPSKPLGLATAKTEDGRRFLFLAFADRLLTFTVAADAHTTGVHLSWSSDRVHPIVAPVVANGVLYVVTSQESPSRSEVQLQAFNSATGVNLYTSAPLPDVSQTVTNLALANGHVVFATPDSLYCFGFPVDL